MRLPHQVTQPAALVCSNFAFYENDQILLDCVALVHRRNFERVIGQADDTVLCFANACGTTGIEKHQQNYNTKVVEFTTTRT